MKNEHEILALLRKTEDELIAGTINIAQEINHKRGHPMTEKEFQHLLLTVIAKFGEANADARGISHELVPFPPKAEIDKLIDGFTNEFKRLNPTQDLFV